VVGIAGWFKKRSARKKRPVTRDNIIMMMMMMMMMMVVVVVIIIIIMHGQYVRNIDSLLMNTFLWLSMGDGKAETESEIIAAQDQTLQTKYCAIKILQTERANADYVHSLMRQ